ncbi:MAG TPA: amino acid permease [Nannocystis exedens]|nr:amino acid permease [Nannocystis exedens]
MEPTQRQDALRKDLGLRGVFAIATGTTISAGFFLLPSFAATQAGPAIVAAYAIAGVLLIPAMLSIVELATAMPRSGGSYYFLDRALGPLAGTIGGLGTWLALMLKTSFALVGMGAYLALLMPGDTPSWVYRGLAVGLALIFGLLNLGGAKKSGGFQVALVFGLLAILSVFFIAGVPQIDVSNFDAFFDEGASELASTVGLVFISYVGVTKVASVAEEVHDPEKNLPRGVFVGLGTATAVYVIGLLVMVGVVGAGRLASDPGRGGLPDLTPVATAGAAVGNGWGVGYGYAGMLVLSIAALFAFSSVANAGILSASRYPLAMSRDKLLPKLFQHVSKGGVPTTGVLITVAAIVIMVFADPTKIAKVASAFQLLMFGLLCLAVIVMRESKIDSYDPGFRSPFYPWMQLIGLSVPCFLILQMGWLPTLMTGGLILICIVWFYWYAAGQVDRHGAIYHVFERLGRRRFAGLDTELRGILKEKGLREEDPYDEIIALARVVNAAPGTSFEAVVELASQHLGGDGSDSPAQMAANFLEGTRLGATPVTSGIALPHLRCEGIDLPRMVIVRSRDGIEIGGADAQGEPRKPETVHAIFFLVSAKNDPSKHLRMLAEIAGRVEQPGFMDRWLKAASTKELKEIMFHDDHFMNLELGYHCKNAALIGKIIGDIEMPQSCLIVIIRRDGEYIVPRSSTELHEGDSLTLIGDPPDIQQLVARYGGTAKPHTLGGRSGSFPSLGGA